MGYCFRPSAVAHQAVYWASGNYLKQPVEINPETRNAMTVMKEIILTKQPVELFKILKFEGMASTGGEAKMLIAGGQVKVNGTKEIRKRKQIVADDVIEYGGKEFVVHLQP